ncbi:hypothetical protein [Rhizobium rhizoryzae]|uniref:hypothetical protein n=1 Tax=Rhizobium rhizoryzae TaxID=451876 RepID=UPI0028B0B4A6|nr:hypothetical protein [Rhizobium rhizoryzae]
MTTTNLRPTRPLDLSSHYLSYLDAIDAENQSRHLQGEPLMTYPTFEDFLDLCVEEALEAEPRGSKVVLDSSYQVLDTDRSEEIGLSWFLSLPGFGIASEDEQDVGDLLDSDPWDTSYGSFMFTSSSKH